MEDNLFPLDAWLAKAFTTTKGSESVVQRVTGTQTVSGNVTATVFRFQDHVAGSDRYRAYTVSTSGVRQYAVAGADAIERAFDGTDVIRFPTHVGDTWVQLDTTVDSGQDFDGDGRPDRVTLHAEVTVVSRTTADAPASLFAANALRQRQVLKQTVLPSSGAAPIQLTTTTDTWYAAGYGVVRNEITQQGATSTSTVTEALLHYRTNTQTDSYLYGMVLTKQSPVANSYSSVTPPIYAEFNLDLDEAIVLTPGMFVVTGANGPVSGALAVQGRRVTFTPATPLPNGQYNVKVERNTGAVTGQGLSQSESWWFYIDTVAPTVSQTFPAAESRNAPLNTSISIVLTEIPDEASVNGTTVKLSTEGTVAPATLTIGGDHNGGYIRIDAVGGLQPGRRYTVDLSGVKDTVGLPMQDQQFSFYTTPARFDLTQTLPAPFPSIIASGDINGDGIPDVVYANSAYFSDIPAKLYIRTGRPDGKLNEPVAVDTGPLARAPNPFACTLSSLAIGDVTGDGRADIVLGSRQCGILVLQQTTAGTLEVGTYLDNKLVDVLRLADVDGDGRLDVVGVLQSSTQVVMLRQNANGLLVATNSAPSLGNFGGTDLAVADIDRDGRADLAVTLASLDTSVSNMGTNVALFRQQPDGSFAAPVLLSTGYDARGVAVGDMNGDGRPDIIASTSESTASVTIFQQAPDGSFSQRVKVPTSSVVWGMRVADINNDGRPDLVTMHWPSSETIGIYLQQASGTLLPEETYAYAGTSTDARQALDVIDLNRDGRLEILASGSILYQLPSPGNGPLGAEARRVRAFTGRVAN